MSRTSDTHSNGYPEAAAADVGICDVRGVAPKVRTGIRGKAVDGFISRPRARTVRSAEGREKKAVDGFKSAFPPGCGVCSRPMDPGRRGQHKQFCSDRCRTVAWAFRLVREAVEAGEAEGLRDPIEGLKTCKR